MVDIMPMEGDEMSISFEKTRVNLYNIGGFALVIFGMGVTYATMQTANETNAKTIAELRQQVKDVQQSDAKIIQLQYQMTTLTGVASENRKAIEEVNKRIDRVVESFGGKLDTVIERVNQIATNVEVLKTSIGERPKRTSVNP